MWVLSNKMVAMCGALERRLLAVLDALRTGVRNSFFKWGKRQTEEFHLFKQVICGEKQCKPLQRFARTSLKAYRKLPITSQ